MSDLAQQYPAEFTGRFRDAALKYQHAQKHFALLVGLINELMGGHWWRPEKVEDCPVETVRIRILREPTADWSLVLGDYVHNLRSCLDYAICGVVQIANPIADLSRV
ncbi:hypothetical protein CN065_14045 [Sinorhizobium meliloti]|uniref:hypothetical protein n=1 Tax=Rhizobium meliloti TaxID=382 RepID=UPI000B49B282|nr:hypothetical protein [Sinorhizobium meliloti]ASP98449.1 hypothetical protein CDO24_14020 [Sinorhizobium meliloti]MQV66195.1 hypothetical protein [Sinorhizobium meliloti]RVQ39317.1 hypothetical protein CN065_14045 [Sinorhizobium meliloti]